MDVWITHLGHAVPRHRIAQHTLTPWLQQRLHPDADPRKLALFASRSGVAWRASVLDLLGTDGDLLYPLGRPPGDARLRSELFSAHAPLLAEAAVRQACPHGLPAITHLIAVTCTGAVAPGLDLLLIDRLGLPRDTRRTVVGFMGCYAALPALRLARDTIRANPQARVLVVCCELSSLHLQPGPQDDDLLAAALFGDGAAAAILSAEPGLVRVEQDACAVVPDSGDAMAWTAGPTGFALRLAPSISRSLAPAVPGLAARLVAAEEDVQWLVHPGGPRILDDVQAALGLPADALQGSRRILAEGGNRSSGTILAILSETLTASGPSTLGLLAFGPGLTAEGLRLTRPGVSP